MNCLANICYVCLENTSKSISNINSSLSVNKDIIHIIGYLPFNLAWLKTKRDILICEACCLRLRETYQFLEMCLKNSARLQGYMDNLNTGTVSSTETEEEPTVTLDINNKHTDIHEVKCEIKLGDDEMYRDECGPMIEETQDVCVNFEQCSVKEEDTRKREEADDTEEHPMDNNSTAGTDHVSDSEISVNSDAHVSDTDFNEHGRVPVGERPFQCSICAKCFGYNSYLVRHMRVHTGEYSYVCSICKKGHKQKEYLARHMWAVHRVVLTGNSVTTI